MLTAMDDPVTSPHGFPVGGDAAYILGPHKLILNAVPQASWQGPMYPNSSVWETWSTVANCTDETTGKLGCLFNIIEDPSEHYDLALAMPEKAAEIVAKMKAAQETVYEPDRGMPDHAGACRAVVERGGFWGPWL